MTLNDKKINFLGDSITVGCGSTARETRYVNRISKSTNSICRNYGENGTRIARQTVTSEVPQYDNDFCLRAENMETDADFVIVFGGTNDYGHGDAPIGMLADNTPYTFFGALDTLYRLVSKNMPNAKLVFITPTHRKDENNPFGEGGKTKASPILLEYVDAMRIFTTHNNLPLLDLFSNKEMPSSFDWVNNYTEDGLHPNDEGHRVIAEQIIKFVDEL